MPPADQIQRLILVHEPTKIHLTRGVHGNGNFPRDSHGNGSSFGLLMGMGMGIVLIGMGIAYFIGEK